MDTSGKFASFRLGQQGQSLIQVMVSAAVMAILMLALATMNEMQQKNTIAVQINMTRSLLQMNLQQNLQNATAINKTINSGANPAALNTCVSGNPCTSPSSGGFTLIDSMDNVISGPSSASPKRYDYQGAPDCAANTPQCMFEVFTQYKTECPPSVASPCSNAIVTATYTIQQNKTSGFAPVAGAVLKPIVSPAISISKVSNYKGSLYQCDCTQGGVIKYSFVSVSNATTGCTVGTISCTQIQ